MGLSKKDLQEIRSVFSDEIQKLKPPTRYRAKDLSKLTKKRLYAYPLLKINIERYKADIEDIILPVSDVPVTRTWESQRALSCSLRHQKVASVRHWRSCARQRS